MSSIVVLGDTSGGVTLSAPAVAGTVTVTLPATSGTMAVSGASQSFTDVAATGNLTVDGNTVLGDASTDTLNVGNGGLVKDASGNVGIGTASPAYKLDITTAATTADGIVVRGTSSGASASANLILNGYGNSWAIACGSTANNSNALTFKVDAFGSPSEKMRIDTSGNVGIGTISPTVPLDVVGAQIRVSSSSGLGVRQTFTSTSTNGRTYQIGSNFVTGTGEFAIYDATAAAERMRIDSSGRVTTPYQPYFYAGSTYTGTLISAALMPYDTVTANIGNHYNTSTYLFTAPIAGRYLFTFSALNYPSSSSGELFFTVNGGAYTSLVRNNSIVAQQSIAGSAILNLSANDTVGVKGTLYFYATAGHGQFSGILLG